MYSEGKRTSGEDWVFFVVSGFITSGGGGGDLGTYEGPDKRGSAQIRRRFPVLSIRGREPGPACYLCLARAKGVLRGRRRVERLGLFFHHHGWSSKSAPSCLAAGSNGISAGECLSSLFSSFPPFSQLFLVPVSIPNPALERGCTELVSCTRTGVPTYCTYRYRTFYLESGIKIEETRTHATPFSPLFHWWEGYLVTHTSPHVHHGSLA